MGLKPDHWIRKMALEHRMIEPFVDGQVCDGVISYGLSSYGYDIRVADEFKIFQPEITAAKLSDVQCAYVAGMLDARGEIGYKAPGQQGRPGLEIVITNGDRQMLEGLEAIIGTGQIRETGGQNELIVSKAADVQYILSQVWAHLTHRRDAASRALAELKSSKSIVVDPKQFDAASFVDFKGETCVIPPNSFALSRTVEYFHIPRSVLTVCLGKSSYARCGIIVNVTPFEPCYSDDTEILTSDGWRLFKDVGIGDSVLAMRKDGIAEWQQIAKKQVYEYKGDMIHFDGKSIDLLVTPEHKVLVRRQKTKRTSQGPQSYKTDWYTVKAEKVYGRWNYEMSRQVLWEGEKLGDTVTINGNDFPTGAFLEFLGHYIGDGSSYVNKGGYMIQLAAFKPSSIERCADILDRLGVKYGKQDTGFYFFSKPLFEFVNPLGHANEKYIPKWVKELSSQNLELLIKGLMHADGNIETQTYTTTSQRLADDIQEITFKADCGAVVRNVGKNKVREWRGRTIKSNHDIYKIRLTKKQLTPKIRPSTHKILSYNGYVYDVTVPNHIIFVRRNGKAVWSGNCWEGYVTLEISNTTPLPAKIYANEGIAQVLFFEADEECEISYADRKGKYQRQQSIVLPRL